MIGAVPEQKETRGVSRYEAVIATLIGLLAVSVSAYTAYMQRQQVRAAVWPILEFDSGNGPIHFTLANKGVGPAIIKHVILKVDDQPVKNWAEVLEKILGPGYHPGEEADMSGRVFSAGESTNVFTPHNAGEQSDPFRQIQSTLGKIEYRSQPRHGRDLLLLDARRMLDLARWRYDIEHHNLDTPLPDSVGDHLPAVVSALSGKCAFRSKIVTLLRTNLGDAR